jgi:phage terminase small subunit
MPRGGSRANTGGARSGAGRPPKLPRLAGSGGEKQYDDPLAYLLALMNDPGADVVRRDRAAIAAAPFVHAKAGAAGKKEDAQEAAGRVGKGRLATPATPPRLIVNNQK